MEIFDLMSERNHEQLVFWNEPKLGYRGIIAIHDIPYEIAKRRNHPHQDAIHVAGWVSLFTLHAIWPFLWIWATLYKPDRGYGFAAGGADNAALIQKIEALEARIAELEAAKPLPVAGDAAPAPAKPETEA